MRRVVDGWEGASCAPGGDPAGWAPGGTGRGDDLDWWFRATVDAPASGTRLVFEGLATLSEVFVDAEPVAAGESMWLPVEVPLAPGPHGVTVRCRALAPELAR